jgi:hypothetical protein
MHWLVIGLAVALGVIAVVALVLLLRLRSRTSREVEERVAATMETLEARLDELTQELTSAVQRAEEEARRSRFLALIGTTIDLDEALASTLEAASALPKVDAAVVELEPTGDEKERLLGSVGFGDEAIGSLPARRLARSARRRARILCRGRRGRAVRALGVHSSHAAAGSAGRRLLMRPEARFGEDDRRRSRRSRSASRRDRERAASGGTAAGRPDKPASTTGASSTKPSREVDRASATSGGSLVLVDVDAFKET